MLESNLLWFALLVAVIIQTFAWLLQLKFKNADFVDIAWSFGLVIVSLIYLSRNLEASLLTGILILAPVLWYFRLGLHLSLRFNRNKEDGRYAYLRRHWQQGSTEALVQLKFYLFFLFQALLIWFFSLPVYLILEHSGEVTWALYLALFILITSFVGVTISDNQLRKFKQAKSGEVCNQGLWKYSRHPNYFFEWLHWCAYPLLGWHLGAESNGFWWLLVTYPIWMFLFLWKFTGIPFNEQQNLRSKGDKYRHYQATTNAFFPGKPKQQIQSNEEFL